MRFNGYDGFIFDLLEVDDLEIETIAPNLYHIKFSEPVYNEDGKYGKLITDIPLLLECQDGTYKVISSNYMKTNKN